MYNHSHKQNMWCANAMVGAPWACGEPRYDKYVENYKHYEGAAEFYLVSKDPCDGRSELNNGCKSIKSWKDGGKGSKKKETCKKSYQKDDGIHRPCEAKDDKCKMKTSGDICFMSGTASTTFYGTQQNNEDNDDYLNNGKDSSCGCNTNEQTASVLSDWYNAAVNDTLFGIDSNKTSNTDWNCGSGCGRCYELTTTGRRADNPTGSWESADMPTEKQTIKVVSTNMCPNVDNSTWCAAPGQTSDMGYEYHFDLQNSFPDGSWAGCNGESCNAEVTFKEIACPPNVVSALQDNCKGTSPVNWAVKKDGCKYS